MIWTRENWKVPEGGGRASFDGPIDRISVFSHEARSSVHHYPSLPETQQGHSPPELSLAIHVGSQSSASSLFRNPHSHSMRTRHPSSRSCCWFLASRAMVSANLARHRSLLLAGVLVSRHPGWRCQKQPCTKIARRYLGSTMSGLPGKCLTFRRKRNPCRCRYRRTFNSGCVFSPRMADIIFERVFGPTISTAE